MPQGIYPYDLRYDGRVLKQSVTDSLYTLADSLGPVKAYEREEYFDYVREMYPQIDDEDMWDAWRDWYDTVSG